MDKEEHIIQSWSDNAGHWIDILEKNGIESRRLATNAAIVKAVTETSPKTLLDIGCGEGWLSAALQQKGIAVTGIDIIPELIERARLTSNARFIIAGYDDLAEKKIPDLDKFDVVVINFALLGKESAENLLKAIPACLNEGGFLFIQTLHPHARKAMDDYNSGWKQGSWDGLGDQFTNSYNWYFRTLEDWLTLLKASGFGSVNTTEVFHPENQKPLSVIFKCRVADNWL